MMLFQSHVPGCVDAKPAIPKQEFKSLEDLLNNPWIKSWNDPAKENFRYCWSPNDGSWSKATLMAEWTEDNKKHWWVLGYISEIPELEEWSYPKDGNNDQA